MANLIILASVNLDWSPIRTVAPYQLASWLRQHDYTVKVIDFCHLMSTTDLVEIIEKNIDTSTLAIGVSSTFWNNNPIIQVYEPAWIIDARKIIDSRYTLPWLLGGAASNFSSRLLQWRKFHGNAEDSLLKWMDENSSKLKHRELFNIQTLTKSFLEDDLIRPDEALPIELGRGCQFKCRFCSYPLIGKKKGTYLRDFGLIKDEFLRNYEEWGTTRYYFQDDTVNESEEKIRALADIAQSLPFKLEWTGYNRLDLIWSRPGTIQMLKDSGLRSAFFGIESFHPVASMAVGKGWSGKHGKDFLLKLKKEWNDEITWTLSFIIGLPGEDRKSIDESVKWCIDNEMYNWGFHPLYINNSPGKLWKSEFDIDYKKYGYTILDGTFDMWKNDLWTRAEAVEYSNKISVLSDPYCKPTCWLLSDLAGLGYTYEELMIHHRIDLDWSEFNRRTTDIIQKYVNHQLR